MAAIKFNSIRQRFTTWLVVVIALILFVFAFFLIHYNNESAKKALLRQLTNISDIAQISLSTALWHINNEYVSDYINSLFLHDDIVYVGVFTENSVVATKAQPGYEDKSMAFFSGNPNFIVKETLIDFNDIRVGRIIIVMSYDRINQLIISNSSLAIFLLCLIIAAIFITNYLLLEHYIFRPVKKLESSARLIAKGNLDADIDITSKDEIGSLAKTFHQMMLNIKSITTSRDKLNHEVKERQKIQKALEESNERFLQLANNTSDLFWLFDVSDFKRIRVLYLNPSFETMWHRKIPDVYKAPGSLLESLHPEDREIVFQRFIDFITSQGKFHTEFRIVLPDKSIRYLWARGNLIFDETGKLTRVAGIAQDITDQFQAQKEKEILKKQLEHAHKMEAIGTLAGGIAHDFNNILGIIIGNAELAIEDVPQQNPARLSLEEIITASRRAKDVVWQLLSFSRKNEKEKEKEPVVLASILKESLSLLRSSIPKTIDVQLNLLDTDSRIMADATQIHQVIINLCTNAAHAMADQGGQLEVRLEDINIGLHSLSKYKTLSFGDYVKLSVRDTGHGIDPEIKDRIFDPYFTTKAMGKGTGMGLAVVHGIVKNHGGEISVKITPFSGTTFEIVFPALSPQTIVKVESDKYIPKGKERILFVDDEVSLIDIGKRILTHLGYTVTTYTNPVEALNHFQQTPDSFDLVITDMTMPEMTGDILTTRLLKIKPDIPVLLCTGFSERITEQGAIKIGARRYIEKPLNLQQLAKIVRKALDDPPRKT